MINSISAWVLSIAGIICLSALVELVLPEGQMAKYIKGVFSFFVIFIIVSPIPKLIKKEININSIFKYQEVRLQEDYLHQMNIYKLEATQNDINDEVLRRGYCDVIVSISADVFSEKIIFKGVYVDLKNLVISDTAQHKNIVDIQGDIRTIVLNYADVKEEVIYFER